MAEYEQKDMTGSLWPNDKGDNDKRPDMKGTMTINGVKYSLSAWNNVAQSSGNKYLSLKLSEFEKSAPLDDSIPF